MSQFEQMENSNNISQLRITQSMTIYHATELKILLQTSLANKQPLVIDLSEVGEIDTTGLQLLLSLRCDKKPVSLVNPSHCIKQLTELLKIYNFMEFEINTGVAE